LRFNAISEIKEENILEIKNQNLSDIKNQIQRRKYLGNKESEFKIYPKKIKQNNKTEMNYINCIKSIIFCSVEDSYYYCSHNWNLVFPKNSERKTFIATIKNKKNISNEITFIATNTFIATTYKRRVLNSTIEVKPKFYNISTWNGMVPEVDSNLRINSTSHCVFSDATKLNLMEGVFEK
ncbi:hypothetical protein Avbf_15222, partial [Armadillidium vulgare]